MSKFLNDASISGNLNISGSLSTNNVNSTQFGYLSGATGNIQSQINTLTSNTTGKLLTTLSAVNACTNASYFASATAVKELATSVGNLAVDIVSWADGTDQQIVKLIKAANAGLIDLYNDCGWRVGDKRSITIEGTTSINFALLHRGGYYDVNNKQVNWIIGAIYQCGSRAMNSTATNNGSWNSSAMRTYLNNDFYTSKFPSSLRPILKQFKCKTAASYNGNSLQTTNDYIALPALKEVTGINYNTVYSSQIYYANPIEDSLFQFDYFKNNSYPAGSNNRGWTRSPYYSDSSSFATVEGKTLGAYSAKSSGLDIYPIFCI